MMKINMMVFIIYIDKIIAEIGSGEEISLKQLKEIHKFVLDVFIYLY